MTDAGSCVNHKRRARDLRVPRRKHPISTGPGAHTDGLSRAVRRRIERDEGQCMLSDELHENHACPKSITFYDWSTRRRTPVGGVASSTSLPPRAGYNGRSFFARILRGAGAARILIIYKQSLPARTSPATNSNLLQAAPRSTRYPAPGCDRARKLLFCAPLASLFWGGGTGGSPWK